MKRTTGISCSEPVATRDRAYRRHRAAELTGRALRTVSVIAIALMAEIINAAEPPASPKKEQPSPHNLSFVAVGDLLGPYQSDLRLDDPSFAKVVSIVKGADVAFANQEGSTFDLEAFGGWVRAGRITALPPHSLATTRAFKEMGFDLFSRANNHTTDWGVEGMLATDRALDAIGIAHAGTGRSLEAARTPAHFQSARVRVALIASASYFPDDSPAGGPSRSYWPPTASIAAGTRPGLNPLRVQKVTLVTPEEMSTLYQIQRRAWSDAEPQGTDQQPPRAGAELGFRPGALFRVSDKPGVTYNVSKKDRADIIESVATADHSADLVVYSIHAHEGRSSEAEGDPDPADFLTPLFHDVVDAGADIVVRSGPHILKGVEIYRGKPILYGLGNFFLDYPPKWVVPGEYLPLPDPSPHSVNYFSSQWYESAIAASEFRNGVLSKVIIYPLILDDQDPSPLRGYPKLAQGADARRILESIQQNSARFGTKLEIVNGVGIVKGPGAF